MSDFMDREQLERMLQAELDEAEHLLRHATPEQKPEARERFQDALRRFSELVIHGKVPKNSRCA